MTIPALILGIVVSTFFGAAFHLWRGGSSGRLVLYMILSWAGFWAGHILADLQGWTFGKVGPLNLGTAILICLAALLIGHWLSLLEVQPKR